MSVYVSSQFQANNTHARLSCIRMPDAISDLDSIYYCETEGNNYVSGKTSNSIEKFISAEGLYIMGSTLI